MGLKEAFMFMNDEHILVFDNRKDVDLYKRTMAQLSCDDKRIQVDDLIEKLKNDKNKYGNEEIVWIYFKEDNDILVPYKYRIPKYERFCFREPSIETLLETALEVFTLAIK